MKIFIIILSFSLFNSFQVIAQADDDAKRIEPRISIEIRFRGEYKEKKDKSIIPTAKAQIEAAVKKAGCGSVSFQAPSFEDDPYDFFITTTSCISYNLVNQQMVCPTGYKKAEVDSVNMDQANEAAKYFVEMPTLCKKIGTPACEKDELKPVKAIVQDLKKVKSSD